MIRITQIRSWQNGQQIHPVTKCAQPAVAIRTNKGNEDTLLS